jgi:hypothetical protein
MKQSNPTAAAVAVWLKQLNREQLHGQGWIAINKRFHGITRAARPFLNDHFADEKERQAAFDGLTLALMTISRFEDIEKLVELLASTSAPKELPSSSTKRLSQPDKTPEAN